MYWFKTSPYPHLQQIFSGIISSNTETFVQFVLDPGVHPEVIRVVQQFGQQVMDHIMYLTRTFTFYLHKERLILLGRWPGMTNTSSVPSNQTPTLIDSRDIGSSVQISNHLSVSGPLMCPYTMLWNSAMTDSCTFLPPVSLH